MYITTQNIFLIPDHAVAQNLIIIFNLSSQGPHLKYIFLSYVYSGALACAKRARSARAAEHHG